MGGEMNKKQLIVLWVMGIAIIIIAFVSPFEYGRSRHPTPVFFIRNILPVLIIGGSLLYTLHLYPQFSFKKAFKKFSFFKKIFKIIGGILLVMGVVWGVIVGIYHLPLLTGVEKGVIGLILGGFFALLFGLSKLFQGRNKKDKNKDPTMMSDNNHSMQTGKKHTAKSTHVDWIALVAAYLIASFIVLAIIQGGISKSDVVGHSLFLLGGAIAFTVIAIVIAFLFSHKISITTSALLGFAIVCFLYSALIYGQARDAGFAPGTARLLYSVFSVVMSGVAWGLYWLIKTLLKV
jgi:hypothetical protein